MLQQPPTLPGSHQIHAPTCQDMAKGYFQALASHSHTQLCWTALVLMLALSHSQPIFLRSTWRKWAQPRVFLHQNLKPGTENGKNQWNKNTNRKPTEQQQKPPNLRFSEHLYQVAANSHSGDTFTKIFWNTQHYRWLFTRSVHLQPTQYLLKPKEIKSCLGLVFLLKECHWSCNFRSCSFS